MQSDPWLRLADLERTFAGRHALIRKLLKVFVDTYDSFPADLMRLVDTGDTKALLVQLHSLKGASASLGAELLRARVAALESALKSGSASALETADAVVSFWPEVMQNARTILETLGPAP